MMNAEVLFSSFTDELVKIAKAGIPWLTTDPTIGTLSPEDRALVRKHTSFFTRGGPGVLPMAASAAAAAAAGSPTISSIPALVATLQILDAQRKSYHNKQYKRAYRMLAEARKKESKR